MTVQLEVAITPMSPEDIVKVAEIWIESLPSLHYTSKAQEIEKIRSAQTSYPEGCWKAKSNKEILGFIIATKYDSDIMYLQSIAVRRKNRNHGIGTLLLRKILTVAARNEFHAIFLTTAKTNPAKDLYLKEGYEVIAETNLDLLLFKKVCDATCCKPHYIPTRRKVEEHEISVLLPEKEASA